MTDSPLVPIPPPGSGFQLDLSKLSPEARAFVSASKAPETVRVYSYHWRAFERWCVARGVRPLPADPHSIADYIAHRALHGVEPLESADDQAMDASRRVNAPEGSYIPRRTYAERWKYSTITQALAAIRLMHRMNGLESPCDAMVVEEAKRGISAVAGALPEKKQAISVQQLRESLEKLGDDLAGKRDRALLLLGFAGALRRGELAAVEVSDLSFPPEGIRLDLRRHFSGARVVPGTKANRGGKREEFLGIPRGAHEGTCPVRAVSGWLEASAIREGRVFRAVRGGAVGEPLTPQTVALAVKEAVVRLGLDPSKFAGHSLRSGLATSAARARVPIDVIQKQTRHASLDTLMGYIRAAGLFEENAAGGIGL